MWRACIVKAVEAAQTSGCTPRAVTKAAWKFLSLTDRSSIRVGSGHAITTRPYGEQCVGKNSMYVYMRSQMLNYLHGSFCFRYHLYACTWYRSYLLVCPCICTADWVLLSYVLNDDQLIHYIQMQLRAAAVACRQLGFPLGGVPYIYGQQGSTNLPVVAANLVCKGNERRLHVRVDIVLHNLGSVFTCLCLVTAILFGA